MVSRAELMREAKDLGIKGRSKMKKAELEEAVRRAKEMGQEATENKTSEPPKKVGRGRPKKAPMAPQSVKKAPKMTEARATPKMAEARAAPKQMPPKQIEAKKAEMMRVQTANKRARGY
jgi:hypothetical protein